MRKLATILGLAFALTLNIATPAQAVSLKGSEIVLSVANSYAAQFGQKIAEAGGSPVDVAIAMVLTMAVTNPTFATLGGGGFAVVKVGNRVTALDFRE